MIKLLFVIENLGGGGAERVLVNLVNHLDKTKYDITLITLFEKGVNASSLNSSIKLLNLNIKKFSGMKYILKFIPSKILYKIFLRKTVDIINPDVIVAYMTGVPTFLVAGAPYKKIAWLHGEFFKDDYLNIFGLKHIYNKYDRVAGVSKYVCDCFDSVISPKVKSQVIYNTNDFDRIISLSNEPYEKETDKLIITTVGCLEKTKGYDRLIPICKRLVDDGFDFLLYIMGEGVERPNLEKQISDLGLSKNIKLLGYCSNPFNIEKNSDLFVCSSRTEGLSTAVTEAVILGVPVVSTDVSGAKEILGENNEYGIVTENTEEALYKGIKKMLENEDLREHYKKKTLERAEFFATENTVKQAEELFKSVID